MTETRSCRACGNSLKGRVDKKFCDDYCRNNFNNRLRSRSDYSALVRNINNALLKNRKLLESLLPADQETAKTTRAHLQLLGFHFKYFTHLYITKTGKVYHYCYDHGYIQLENDWVLVVRKRE
jgi:hypothetical protein